MKNVAFIGEHPLSLVGIVLHGFVEHLYSNVPLTSLIISKLCPKHSAEGAVANVLHATKSIRSDNVSTLYVWNKRGRIHRSFLRRASCTEPEQLPNDSIIPLSTKLTKLQQMK